ncbi:organic cation transporter-like protein [Homarus americanus]|uniref:organic cation transporter-like protein n=1 Tax=Homarus americanus TaxID=6706 RepID=UPI001C43A1D6|nr:organic cation transporter-like protein [Homarus americanus]
MGVHLDRLMTSIGTGSWNIFHFATLSYWFCMTSFHTLGGPFLAPKVNSTCLPLHRHLQQNITLVESCSYLVADHLGEEEEYPCTQWSFDDETFSSTVTSDFSLVCGREYLRATYQSIYMLGIFVAAPLNGVLADRYGRLPMIRVSTVLYTILAVGSCWLPSLWTLLMARFLLGLMHPTSLQTGYILAMEMAEPKLRTTLGVGLFVTWSLGTVIWGGAAYIVRDWRWLQLSVSLPCILFLPSLWILNESPRWLAVRGRHNRALKVLKKAAHWNQVTLPPDEEILEILKDDQIEVTRVKT